MSGGHSGAAGGSEGCPFCRLIAGGGLWLDEQRHIVSFVPLNPVTDGHRLFVPRSHVTVREAPDRVAESFGAAAAYGRRFLAGADFNLILNCGPAASQTIEHLHVHLVPRRPNDGLRLPWTGQRHATVPDDAWAREAQTWGQGAQEWAEATGPAAREAWDASLTLIEQADRDHPAEMAAARAELARDGGEPVQRRRRCAHPQGGYCPQCQTEDLDARVAREIGGMGGDVEVTPGG